jgi:hypothetical protein
MDSVACSGVIEASEAQSGRPWRRGHQLVERERFHTLPSGSTQSRNRNIVSMATLAPVLIPGCAEKRRLVSEYEAATALFSESSIGEWGLPLKMNTND